MKRISYFDTAWDHAAKQGAVRLTFDDRSQADLRGLSLAELGLLCSILRAEKPVYYDEATSRFSTDQAYGA